MNTFKIEDMTCGNCEKAIRNKLAKHHPQAVIEIDLKQKTLRTDLPEREVSSLLEEIGYNPTKVN